MRWAAQSSTLAVRRWAVFRHWSCTPCQSHLLQVNIQGDQSGVAPTSAEVTFPGGYSDTDPGIYDPTIFDTPIQYTFPGPPVVSFAASGSNTSSPTSSSPSSTGAGAPASSPTASSSGSGSGSQCRLGVGQAAFALQARRPRSVSRVMGRWWESVMSSL